MADINTLLGMGVSPQDNMQALADKLRGEQQLGNALGMSTLSPVAQYGQNMATGAAESASRGGVLRQAMKKEQQAQDNYNSTALAKTQAAKKIARASVDKASEMERVNKDKATALAESKATAAKEAAKLDFDDFEDYVDADGNHFQIAQRAGEVFTHNEAGDITRTTLQGKRPFVDPTSRNAKRGIQTIYGSPKQQKQFEDLADESENQLTVFGQYKPEYSSSSKMPFVGSVENALARNLPNLSSDEMVDQQRWWRDYNKEYKNIARHKLFGSALTAAEIKAWEQANVDADSSPEQTADAMATLTYLTRKLAEKSKENAIIKDRDPEYIQNNYGYLDNYSPFVDLSVVPEGMDMKEWEELTYKERQEVLDMGIN